MQFVSWYCKGSSIAPLSDYANNPTFQESPNMNDHFSPADETLFIDLRRGKGYTGELEKINRDGSNLAIMVMHKAASTKKMMLHITGYYQGEYLYSLSNEGLIMNYKVYRVSKPNSIALAA